MLGFRKVRKNYFYLSSLSPRTLDSSSCKTLCRSSFLISFLDPCHKNGVIHLKHIKHKDKIMAPNIWQYMGLHCEGILYGLFFFLQIFLFSFKSISFFLSNLLLINTWQECARKVIKQCLCILLSHQYLTNVQCWNRHNHGQTIDPR